MAKVYIGIGSNLGDRQGNCSEAIKRIGDIFGVEIEGESGFYETVPVGGPPQPLYINGVVCLKTNIDPPSLLNELKSIEKNMGRGVSLYRDHPRVIDLDILLFGDINFKSDDLVIPHPRMHLRSFVLIGLSKLDPRIIHPTTGKTVEELLKQVNRS